MNPQLMQNDPRLMAAGMPPQQMPPHIQQPPNNAANPQQPGGGKPRRIRPTKHAVGLFFFVFDFVYSLLNFVVLGSLQVKVEHISIEDALKNEIDDKSMKTPISILQELLSRRGITPNYELVQIEGAVHKPMFKYRVSFNDKEAFGCGPSKKQAKHNCAKALIALLTGQPMPVDEFDGAASNGGGGGGTASSDVDEDKIIGNPIGQLQELCMGRKWPPPTYETEMEVGLPHARQFTIACYVLNHHEIGTGKSKKIAKRNAANKMLCKLKEIPIDQNLVIQMTDEDGNDIKVPVTNYADLKDAKIATLTNQHSYKV